MRTTKQISQDFDDFQKQLRNVAICTDAYKGGHYEMLPTDAEGSRAYIAPRKAWEKFTNEYVVFGVSYAVAKYLSQPINDLFISYAKTIWDKFDVLGKQYPFPEEGFRKIVKDYNGYLPIVVKGVPEGKVLTKYNVPVVIVTCEEKEFPWLSCFVETVLQRSIWYGSTVATLSRMLRQVVYKYYKLTVDEEMFWSLNSRIHDFGARGASTGESAALGGLAHLVLSEGTDTMEAVLLGNLLYETPVEKLACSIRATEHSVPTSYGTGLEAERKALVRVIETAKPRTLFSFVSDTFDYKRCVDELWGDPEIIKLIRDKNLLPVVRPDSGQPEEMVAYALDRLAGSWGFTENKKGYKVLNGIRIIQGDGMNLKSVRDLYRIVRELGYSAENLAVGIGGGLLQKVNRDDMSWSMKMYQIKRNGEWYNVQKKPKTDSAKTGWDPQNGLNMSDYITYYDKGEVNPEVFNFLEIRDRARTGLV